MYVHTTAVRTHSRPRVSADTLETERNPASHPKHKLLSTWVEYLRDLTCSPQIRHPPSNNKAEHGTWTLQQSSRTTRAGEQGTAPKQRILSAHFARDTRYRRLKKTGMLRDRRNSHLNPPWRTLCQLVVLVSMSQATEGGCREQQRVAETPQISKASFQKAWCDNEKPECRAPLVLSYHSYCCCSVPCLGKGWSSIHPRVPVRNGRCHALPCQGTHNATGHCRK